MIQTKPDQLGTDQLGQRSASQLWLLCMCASPRSHHVLMLEPNDRGELKNVSRLEAKERGLPVYVGALSAIDKPYPIQGGGWGSVRYACNGNTEGQLRLARNLEKRQKTKPTKH